MSKKKAAKINEVQFFSNLVYTFQISNLKKRTHYLRSKLVLLYSGFLKVST